MKGLRDLRTAKEISLIRGETVKGPSFTNEVEIPVLPASS
jgi:hypothetical protein